jgi:hypothetical protein
MISSDMRIEPEEILFSERALLKKLGLGLRSKIQDGEIVGLRAIWINGRYVCVPEPIDSIKIVVNKLIREEDYKRTP